MEKSIAVHKQYVFLFEELVSIESQVLHPAVTCSIHILDGFIEYHLSLREGISKLLLTPLKDIQDIFFELSGVTHLAIDHNDQSRLCHLPWIEHHDA